MDYLAIPGAQVEVTPLILAPLALVAWLVVLSWWVRSLDHPGRLRRKFRSQRLWWEIRVKRRSRMRAAVARANHARKHERSDLPPDEHVSWASFWMVEIYLGSHAPDLKQSFERLGWTEDSPGLGSINAEEWLADARAGYGLSWTRLGFFRPRGAKLFPTATPIDLPEPFAFLQMGLVQLGPGVTALIANFALAEDEQSCLERAIREAPAARGELAGHGGYRILSPELVKAERVGAERARIRGEAACWIRDNLPGAFSTRAVDPPTWDLITTTREDLVKEFRGFFGWQDALGFRGAERWKFMSGDRDDPELAIYG